MPLLPRALSLWRNLLRRRQVEQDLDDELRATFDLLVEEKRRAGLTEDAARLAASRELGSMDALKDHLRDARAGALFDTVVQDLRYGARLLRRNPLFTVTATLSLAICLGANTAVFTLVNKLLFASPAGVMEPDRLVDLAPTTDGRFSEPFVHPLLLSELRERATLLEPFGFGLELQPLSVRGTSGAEAVFGGFVTGNYFDALGVRPAAGRLLGRDDGEHAGESPFVVLSHAFWTRRFEGDRAVVGAPFHINGQLFTVIGVAAPEFRGTFFTRPDLWLPASMMTSLGRPTPLAAWGRLHPGVSIAQADAEVNAIAAAVQRDLPPAPRPGPGLRDIRRIGLRVVAASPLPPIVRTLAAGVLALLMGMVALVLVIACANLTGVLLARGAVRRRELAVRLAIGAGRARLLRQMLTETLLLFLLGGAAGVLVARFMTSALALALPPLPVPVDVSLPLDWRVLLFTATLALAASILCGVVPALQASRAHVLPALAADVQGPPPDRLRLRSLFVVAQVAVSIALLVAAGLFAGALARSGSVDQGFDADRVEITAMDLSLAGYTQATGPAFVRTLVERARALPRAAGASAAVAVSGQMRLCCGITVPGVEPPGGQEFFQPAWNVVEPAYFRTLRVALVSGRDFTPADRRQSERVAVVSRAAARQFWPGEEALGKAMLWQQSPGRDGAHGAPLLIGPGGPARRDPVPLTVVGVVEDITDGGREPSPTVYLPFEQQYEPRVFLVTRAVDAAPLAGEVRGLVASIDPDLPVLSSIPLAGQVSPVAFQLRLAAGVSAAVGLIGVLLAAIGVYGVTAYVVTMRTRELAVRMAMGAQRHDIVSMVLRSGMTLVLGGTIAGLALAAAGARLLAHNRFGIPAVDPLTFAGAALLFGGIALVACYVPTRRATRIDPAQALRHE